VYLENFIAACSISRTLYHLYIFMLLPFYTCTAIVLYAFMLCFLSAFPIADLTLCITVCKHSFTTLKQRKCLPCLYFSQWRSLAFSGTIWHYDIVQCYPARAFTL